jgi:hypothetical protein
MPTTDPRPAPRRRWRRWTLASLMLGIAILAVPLAGLRLWRDLPPCATHAGGLGDLVRWARADCAACHAPSPVADALAWAVPPSGGAAPKPFDLAGHATTADRASCVECHAPAER